MTADLEDEFADAVEMLHARPSRIERLVQYGIPRELIFGCDSLVGLAPIVVADQEAGLFDFADAGELHIITPSTEWFGWCPTDDLIAFRPADPTVWWHYRGVAEVLGTWHRHADPVPLFSTPLAYLQHGGRGMCIVDWRLDLQRWFGAVPAIAFDCAALEGRFRRRWVEIARPKFRTSVMGVRHAA